MKERWTTARLGDLCEIVIGRTPARNRSEYWGGSATWLSIGDMAQGRCISRSKEQITELAVRQCGCRQVRPGTVLLSFKLSVGKVAIADVPVYTNEAIAALPVRDGREVDAGYLAHVLSALDLTKGTDRAAKGVTLNQEKLRRIELPLPPLDEQRRIAAILDQADAVRMQRARGISNFDAAKRSLFERALNSSRSARGAEVAKVRTLCSLVNGRAFKPSEWEEQGLPIIRIQNLNDPDKPFNRTRLDLPEKYRVRPGDILFSWSGTPGTSFGCFRWNGPTGWLNQHIFNVKLKDRIRPEFFIASMNAKLGELIAKAHGGVGLQHVTKVMVDETELMVPTLPVQDAFVRLHVALEKVESASRAHLAKLDQLFASLQYRAFRGEL